MRPPSFSLVRWLCDPARHEHLTGDLEELYARRVRRLGIRKARARAWRDLLSVCVRQSRARAWTAQQWATGALLAATVVAGAASAHNGLPTEAYTISARDPAGSFTLKLRHGTVVAATVNESPFPVSRIVRSGSRLTLLGAGAGAGHDLDITVTPKGGIRWEGRPPPQQTRQTPIDLTLAHEYVAELAKASAAEGGKLWGRPLYGPLLLVDPATRFVAANQSDSGGVLTPSDGLFTGAWPAQEPIANTAVSWSGIRWSMIMWPLPGDAYARRRLAFHELFHRIQPDLKLTGDSPDNSHLATRDGRIWTRLEWRALAEALVRRGVERRNAVEDALVFRARRRALFPRAVAEERALELNEGLAEYTGLKLSGLPAWVLADRAAVELANRELQESLSRSFAYASGPAYGVLLDEQGVSWRARATPATDLSELLRAAYRLRIDGTGKGAEQRAARYGGPRLVAQETQLAERIAANEARIRTRLVDGPTVTLPIVSRFRYSFNPNSATPLPDIGTVYESARASDEWGILTVESGGVLLVRSGTSIVRIVVAAPKDGTAPTAGEGWRLELAQGWAVQRGERAGSWEVRRAP